MVPCSSVSFSGQYITAERGPFVGDVSTTDEHGLPRNRGTYTTQITPPSLSPFGHCASAHFR